jgi:glycosyltransferase involved in cell wall biosynthesis
MIKAVAPQATGPQVISCVAREAHLIPRFFHPAISIPPVMPHNISTLPWFIVRRLGLAGPACRYNFVPIASDDIRRVQSTVQISFVVAHWNAPRFVAQLIESIQRHTRNCRYEILIVDDASELQAFNEVQRLAEPDRITRFLSSGGHSRSLEWGFHRSRGEYVVIIDQDALIVTDDWLALVESFNDNPELIVIGVRDKVPGLRNSPQMHHASFMMIHRERCLEKLRPPYFFAEAPRYPDSRVGQSEPYHLLTCKCLALSARTVGYLESYRTKYGLSTASFYPPSNQPLIFHHWFSGRISGLKDSDRIDGLLVSDLRAAQQQFHSDLAAESLDLTPVV